MAATPQAGSSIQGNQHNLTFNINPVFNVTTNNPNFDLKKTAGELVKIVKRELEAEAMRRY